jgi:hypothetical protein
MSTITISDEGGAWCWLIEHDGCEFASGDKAAHGSAHFPDQVTAAKSALENFAVHVARPKDQKQRMKEQQAKVG